MSRFKRHGKFKNGDRMRHKRKKHSHKKTRRKK